VGKSACPVRLPTRALNKKALQACTALPSQVWPSRPVVPQLPPNCHTSPLPAGKQLQQPLALCKGGEECARLLFLKACVRVLEGQPDGSLIVVMIKASNLGRHRLFPGFVLHATVALLHDAEACSRCLMPAPAWPHVRPPCMATDTPTGICAGVYVVQGLSEVKVIGIHDMNVPPEQDFLYRSPEARRLFTQPRLQGAAMRCLQGEAAGWSRAGWTGSLTSCGVFLPAHLPHLPTCAPARLPAHSPTC